MKELKITVLISILMLFGCDNAKSSSNSDNLVIAKQQFKQYVTILGIAQDAGYPQIHCQKECCMAYYDGKESRKLVSCLGLVDFNNQKKWLFDATPDIKEQLRLLSEQQLRSTIPIDGIFLTHAHMGHYTGLMQLGREALGATEIPVYAMPRMKTYLETNGPWRQLVDLNNIHILPLRHNSPVVLNATLKVTPFLVPHRDEFSETVGYKIQGQKKSALFIPDIDKWDQWEQDIIQEVKNVDYAFLDASFFADGELERDMTKIPHPFTTQTTTLFQKESLKTKQKINFIHFNHSNPAIRDKHPLKDSLQNLGFNFPSVGDRFEL